MNTAVFQTRLHSSIRTATIVLLASAATLWLSAASATAQVNPPPFSDNLKVLVNGLPMVDFTISEADEGIPFVYTVPRTIIELTEPGTAGQIQISDRLVIESYVIQFQSDPPGVVGGPGRPIPGVQQVAEYFSPIALRFGSDVENPNGGGTRSDFVDVLVAGTIVAHFDLIENPLIPELPITFAGGPYLFDMMENAAQLSDILDIQQFLFSFESDSTEQGLPFIDILPSDVFFSFPEAGPNGTNVVFGYDVVASSDIVPEPSTLVLVVFGLIGLAARACRRKR